MILHINNLTGSLFCNTWSMYLFVLFLLGVNIDNIICYVRKIITSNFNSTNTRIKNGRPYLFIMFLLC